MTESSILDASIEDILGGEVDENIAYESIDADAILGEVDEFLAENAIKPEDKSKLTKLEAPAENEEEQLDYDEDPVAVNSKSLTTSNAELDGKHERRGGRRGYSNFDDGKYYVNPNFRGPFPPDVMGMPRPPMYMPGPMHPRFYHGYRGPGPMRYPMGGGPFGPMMYGPPMGGMGPRGLGPYGPPRGPPGRFDNRRPHGVGDALAKERNNNKAEDNGENRSKDGQPPAQRGGAQLSVNNGSGQSSCQPAPRLGRTLKNNNGNVDSQQRRTPSPVNRLPTVRIGGSGSVSASSSQTSLIVSQSQTTHIPSVSNVNALISASLRLSSAPSRPPSVVVVGTQPTPSSFLSQQLSTPTPLMMLSQNPSASLQPPLSVQPMSTVYSTGSAFSAQPPPVYLDPVRIVPAVAPIVQPPIVPAPNVAAGGGMDWSLMVDAFVRRTAEADRRLRESTSRSRSYTRSPSGGRSFDSSRSSSGRSRSRSSHSRSRSPMPTRSPRSPLPQPRRRASRNERRGSGRRSAERAGRRAPRRQLSTDATETKVEVQKRSRECAVAIGLDDEYLRKVEEQKRLRDEFTRMRDQKRQMAIGRSAPTADSQSQRRRDGGQDRFRGRRAGSPPPNRGGNGRRGRIDKERDLSNRNSKKRGGGSSQQQITSSSFTVMPNTTKTAGGGDRPSRGRHGSGDGGRRPSGTTAPKEAPKRMPLEKSASAVKKSAVALEGAAAGGKLKAYLAVVVSNVKELENPYKHVVALSDTIGPTKKVWQTSENKISIIFAKHEHAKQFMLQYHGKTLSGSRLDVSLEKVFLNLTAAVS